MMTLVGNETPQNTLRHGQVFQATHMGDSEDHYLPFMQRSFISFSFGERNNKRVNIEDFNLIATISGDRLQRNGYAQFEDNTTNYSNLDGQYYWGTHARANEIEFTLSTDGIDQQKLDEFLYWFRAGETKELILAEHPNRAILARVAEPPQLNLLPFEGKVNLTISNLNYTTSTTLYKGDITLRLIMDEPYWYALENILGTKVEAQNDNEVDAYVDTWTDQNGQSINVFASKDALKILYEDGIPLGSMFDENMLLGNGAYAKIKNDYITWTWEVNDITKSANTAWADVDLSSHPHMYARTSAEDGTILGRVAGAIIDASGNGMSSLPYGGYGYFYYSGNAPAYTKIQFTFTPVINNEGYIVYPANEHVLSGGKKYSTIVVESVHSQELRFTTPSYLTSYNKAVKILRNSFGKSAYTPEDVRATLRDNIHHPYARAWAIHTVDYATNSNSNTWESITLNDVINEMSKFLKDNSGEIASLTVMFNSQTGEATGELSYRVATNSFATNVKENVGDMLCSNHIIIKDRNYYNENGRITARTDDHPEYSHRIYHDMIDVEISNFSIYYKNMYL